MQPSSSHDFPFMSVPMSSVPSIHQRSSQDDTKTSMPFTSSSHDVRSDAPDPYEHTSKQKPKSFRTATDSWWDNPYVYTRLAMMIIVLQVFSLVALVVLAYACWQVSVSINDVTSNMPGAAVHTTVLNARTMSANPLGYALETHPPAKEAANNMFLLLETMAASNLTARAVQLVQSFIADEQAISSVFKRLVP